jgi:hypothetical protein
MPFSGLRRALCTVALEAAENDAGLAIDRTGEYA